MIVVGRIKISTMKAEVVAENKDETGNFLLFLEDPSGVLDTYRSHLGYVEEERVLIRSLKHLFDTCYWPRMNRKVMGFGDSLLTWKQERVSGTFVKWS